MGHHLQKIHRAAAIAGYGMFIRPNKNRIYASCMKNSYIDRYDILNCNSSNLLKFLNQYIQTPHKKKLEIFVEYQNEERLPLYENLISEARKNGITLHFLRTAYGLENDRIQYNQVALHNFKIRLSCAYWLSETVQMIGQRILHGYHQFCLNYFISCKNDYEAGKNNWWSHCDTYITTALLPTQIVSASRGIGMDHCKICGFPRNDSLIQAARKDEVYSWLENALGYRPEHIFLYMPTYRDYEEKLEQARPLMGYDFPDLSDLMRESRSVCIYKLHPWQNVGAIENSSGLLNYEKNYNFSMYDVMAVSDCMIGDYSSATFDFMLLDRPIIYNLYDLEEYTEKRGVSYDPFESFCGGAIVHNAEEMHQAILDVLNHKDVYREKRNRICNLVHKYRDGKSCERVIRAFEEIVESQ